MLAPDRGGQGWNAETLRGGEGCDEIMGSQAAHDAPMRVIRQPKAARGAWSAGDLVWGRRV